MGGLSLGITLISGSGCVTTPEAPALSSTREEVNWSAIEFVWALFVSAQDRSCLR